MADATYLIIRNDGQDVTQSTSLSESVLEEVLDGDAHVVRVVDRQFESLVVEDDDATEWHDVETEDE